MVGRSHLSGIDSNQFTQFFSLRPSRETVHIEGC